jgi:nucleoside-diphosphate-sugar epimerase
MVTPLTGQRILVTGVTGQIAFPMASFLAAPELDNEVFGLARFGGEGDRSRVEAAGIVPVVADLGGGDLSAVPADVDYVLHLATFQAGGLDYDHALRVNAEGTGLLLHHCRSAKGVLVTSTASVYEPNPDRWHVFAETDPLGDTHAPHSPTYSISKITEEAVARTMCRVLDLPVTIARINASYGPNGGLPAIHLGQIARGETVVLRAPGPTPYSPIHQDDLNAQAGPLLSAASVPATIVNWGGDEVVTAEDWCAYLGEVAGRQPTIEKVVFPGAVTGSVMSTDRRMAITGPCTVPWKDGMRRMAEARLPTPNSA